LSHLDCVDQQRIVQRSRQVEVGSVQVEVCCQVIHLQRLCFVYEIYFIFSWY